MDVRATNLLQVLFQFVHMRCHVLDGNIAEPRVPQFVAKGLTKSALLARAAALSPLQLVPDVNGRRLAEK